MVSKSNVFIIQNSHRQFLATNIVIIWQQLSHPKSALVLVEGAPLHTEKFTWRPPLVSFEQITESFTLLKTHLLSQHLIYCTEIQYIDYPSLKKPERGCVGLVLD